MTTTKARPAAADQAASEAEIRRLVDAAVEHQSDVGPFLALHTDDIVLVNLAGRRVIGKAALGAAMTEGLKTRMAKVMTHNQVLDITFVGPDTAVVSCLKRITDENPDAREGSIPAEASLTYVVTRRGAAWLIALAQTTPIL
jgi:uncharacterized protein (TIGR02246 family)